MPTTLIIKADEESTYVVTFAFEDEDDNPVTPNSAEWTLTDISGSIINSRDGIDILPIVQTGDIVLSGDDLAIPDGVAGDVERRFRIAALYDSSLGSDLPLTGEAQFTIENHLAQA